MNTLKMFSRGPFLETVCKIAVNVNFLHFDKSFPNHSRNLYEHQIYYLHIKSKGELGIKVLDTFSHLVYASLYVLKITLTPFMYTSTRIHQNNR